ncbi:Drug resistance protein [Lachnellula cervina]|uniref:Drug resistance protein n=1 Tax=Lachnellula cervina TaxID=1316786 RepID=A0A7D8YT52_9HELO|nr:Drug resistance protein [Lachnellula cervina]
MSLATPPEVGVAPKGNTPGSSHLSGNKDETSCSTFATFSNSHRIVLDHVNEAALAVASQEEITASSTLGPREKERQQRGNLSPAVEESSEARLERLGRQRPDAFDSIWAEIGFVFSISMSQVLSEYFVSGFTVILPTLVTDLHIPAASSTWPASAFSLTVASFLLIFGRVADMKGGYPVYVAGLAWLTVWSLIAGFSVNDIMLNFCRALQGLGPAAFLPSGVMILGSTYRPGPRKNLIFSIYGSCAATGFFIGIFFAGVAAEYTSWGWYFWVGTILTAITALTSYLCIPSDIMEKRNAPLQPKMDWLGGTLVVCGLILFTFALIDSSHAPQQWKTPYIYVLFIIGSLLLLSAAYVETFVASQPLLPASLFKVPRMPALIVALLLTYGSLGIFLLYTTFYMEKIMGATPLQVVAWYVPMALGGCMIATFGGFVLHLLPGTVLIIIAGISWIIAPLLFAIAPLGASYWAYIFPAMICATVGIDITFNVANIFITTSLPRKQQGLAGAVIMLLVHLGIAVFLGFGDIVNTYTVARLGARESYHAVFWFEVACAALALTILVLFVKIKKAESELTVEEREEMEVMAGNVVEKEGEGNKAMDGGGDEGRENAEVGSRQTDTT